MPCLVVHRTAVHRDPGSTTRARAAAAMLLVTLLAVTGCESTRTGMANQDIALRTVQSGQRVGANCSLSNGSTTWQVSSPVRLPVTRSSQPLDVTCRTEDGASGSTTVQSSPGASGRGYPEVITVDIDTPAGRTRPRNVPANVAQLEEIDRVPHLDEAGRNGYRRFLSGDKPRAFVVSEAGRWVRINAMPQAEQLALDRCHAYGLKCRTYAVDDTVVWQNADPAGMTPR